MYGSEMVRGMAAGGGYDKTSAAVEDAARKIDDAHSRDLMRLALVDCDRTSWDNSLMNAGFKVLRAI